MSEKRAADAHRRDRAVEAAVQLARRYLLRVDDPVVLQWSNNTVVHLRPASVVAKVATNPGRRSSGPHDLEREIAVAAHLVAAGAPVAEPSDELPSRLHRHGSFAITFWRYYDHDRDAEISCSEAAQAVRRVHSGLSSYPGSLPDFRDGMPDLRAVLPGDGSGTRLRPRDREFLLVESARVHHLLAGMALRKQALHGGPHRYNLLKLPDRVLVADLETACLGPLEWDAAHLCAGEFPEADPALLSTLRDLVSLNVSAICWARMEASPELAWHAAHHLGLLRARAFRRARHL